MVNEYLIDSIGQFMAAQQQAQHSGRKWFICPACGHKANWCQIDKAGNVLAYCVGCGMKIRTGGDPHGTSSKVQ